MWTGAPAWSGSWRIAVAVLPDGRVQATGGAGHDDSGPVRLEPGGTWVSPVFAGLYSGHGFGAASRAWHTYQRSYVVPDAGRHRPVLFNSWEATGFDVGEEQQRELARRAAAMGVELFVVDDGWFGTRAGDRAGPGDWTPNPDRFPGGLKPLADEVHGLGMGFGVRVEPEMVDPDSDLCRAHPDWVRHHPGRRRTGFRDRLVLDLARDDVREHLADRPDALLRGAPIDFLKWDFNRAFGDPGRPDERYPQQLWPGHVEGLYELIDRLRPPGDGRLTAVQYVHGDDTVVLAWLQAQSFGEPVPPLRLRGLDPAASYRDVVTGVVQRGAVLAERGLRTTLGGDLDAAVFHLRRV